MKNKFLTSVVLASLFLSPPLFALNDSFLFGNNDEALHIVINNRVLAKVNGKAISVMDVVKKMDMLFYRQFPEYISSVQARFQFYQVNWKHILQDLIDKELILADAAEKKLPITPGDIRQEMENLFGPNIIANLDKVGLGYEEAQKIVQGDLIIRRMLFIRVNSKAMRDITPQAIRAAYEVYAKENIRPEEWIYSLISIRDTDSKRGEEVAQLVRKSLEGSTVPASDVIQDLKTRGLIEKPTTVNISNEYKHSEKEMSDAYKGIVTHLSKGEYSQPISQKSRTDNSTVYRLFFLKEKTNGGAATFAEVEAELKDSLLNDAIDKESSLYLSKLRDHFDVQESQLIELSDDDFQPFSLK